MCRSTRTYAGALARADGRWTYLAMLGTTGASAACGTTYPGSSLCTITRLRAAPASELVMARDPMGTLVTSFWAYDPAAIDNAQCYDIPTALRWAYNTGHTPSRGMTVPLASATGALGATATGVGCGTLHWVACCYP
jgi:hypothetical protein